MARQTIYRNPASAITIQDPVNGPVVHESIGTTAESVRRLLPIMPVLYEDGTILKGITAGRQNRFATIITDRGRFECAWETVAHCFEYDQPIRY